MLYLAWLPAWNTPFDPVAHATNEDQCLSFSAMQQEDIARGVITPTFEVTMPNPGIGGFLGRTERYAVLSERTSTDEQAIDLYRGRVHQAPSDLGGQTITLRFECVPPDEDDVIKAGANKLRTGEVDYDPDASAEDRDAAEAYDPLFYARDASDDPSTALAGRLDLWLWNCRTLTLERVHLIEGHSNVKLGSQGIGDLSVTTRNPPRQVTKSRVIAGWTQEAKGVQTTTIGDGVIKTYSNSDLVQSWPQAGSPVGDNTGWYLAESSVDWVDFDQVFDEFDANPATHVNGDLSVTACKLLLRAATVSYTIRLGFDYQQQREEILEVSMPAALQPIIGDDKKEVIEIINLAPLNIDNVTPLWTYEDPDTQERKSYVEGDEVIENGKAWRCVKDHHAQETFAQYDPDSGEQFWEGRAKRAAISPLSATYFTTSRGVRSMRHEVRRVHRQVVERSRGLEITFDCPWPIARMLTCGHTMEIEHRILTNGYAKGKVAGIQLIAQGSSRYTRVTLLAPHGDGSTAPVAGAGQHETGGVVYTLTAPTPRVPVNAAALRAQVPSFEVWNPYSIQKTAAMIDPEPVEAISNLPTRIEIEVEPIREEDLITRRLSIVCEPVHVPKWIALR